MKIILTAAFRHETNRHAPGITDFSDFEKRYCVHGEEAVRQRFAGAREELNGVLDYFDVLSDYCVKPVLALNATPGPVVSQQVFDDTCQRLVAAIKEQPQIDGILLCLHGAMVTQSSEDGEGELLEILRSQVGKDVPIMATLDLHANITSKMVSNADGLFAYYTNPHVDAYDAAMRACKCMHDTLEGKIRPVLEYSPRDFLLPVVTTADPAMYPFVQKAQALSNTPEMIDVSICHGFYKADITDMGISVLSVSDGNRKLAKAIADDLSAEVFAQRKKFRKEIPSAEEAVKIAVNSDVFPVVLADVADNPGSGATADSTGLLKALLEADAQDVAFAIICDPQVAAAAKEAGINSTIAVELGGKVAPEITGGPVKCQAKVLAITDGQFRNRDVMAHGMLMNFGTSALLQIKGVKVIVCSFRMQPWDLEIYRHIGIAPENMKILAVKSAAHFRASFGKVAKKIIEVDAPGLAAPKPEKAGLQHVRRPIYPLDDI